MSNNLQIEETDIYGDLPNFQFDEAFKRLEEEKVELQNKVEDLGAQLDEMKKQNEKLVSKVKSLGKNISCLYKTAQRELERKEQIIADLRKERDDLLFRRGLRDTQISLNKRPSRKQPIPTKKVRNGSIKRLQDSKPKTDVSRQANLSPIAKDDEIYDSVAVDNAEMETLGDKKSEESVKVDIIHNDIPRIYIATTEIHPWEAVEQTSSNGVEQIQAKTPLVEISPVSPELGGSIRITTPIKDKFSVHMTSEDCGFGQRRKIRRVVKVNTLVPTTTTPEKLAVEKGIKHPCDSWRKPEVIEMDPLVAKRCRLENDCSFRLQTPIGCNSLQIKSETKSILMEKDDDEFLMNDTSTLSSECSSSNMIATKVFHKGSVSLPEQDKQTEKDHNEKRDPRHTKNKNDPNSGDVQKDCLSSFAISKFSSINLDISLTDGVSQDVEHLSFQGESDCVTPLQIPQITDLMTRTSSSNEEHNIFNLSNYESEKGDTIGSQESRCVTSRPSSPPNSQQSESRHDIPIDILPQTDKMSKDGRFKRCRSWERERTIYYNCANESLECVRKERCSDRESGREREWRKDAEHPKGADHGKNRDLNLNLYQGRDTYKMRNSERGRDVDVEKGHDRGRSRNEDRCRNLCQGREQSYWKDQVRGRDGDQKRDASEPVKKFSSDPRGSDVSDRRTRDGSRSRKGSRDVWNGYRDRDRPRRDLDERERNGKWCKKKLYHHGRLEIRNPKQSSVRTVEDPSWANRSISPEWD